MNDQEHVMEQILERMGAIEQAQGQINLLLYDPEFLDFMKSIQDLKKLNGDLASLARTVEDFNIIIYGSDRFGVPPLLNQVKELYRFYDRAKWALSALGVTNVGIIIAWLTQIVQNNL